MGGAQMFRGWMVPAALGAALVVSMVGGAAEVEAAGAATFAVDPVHSAVLFKIKHAGTSNNYGRFNTFSGSYTLDEDAPEKSSIEVRIDAASIDTNSEARDKHLRGPDFFAVKQFPEISFVSSSVKRIGDGYAATGTLSLHGVEKTVTLPFTKVGEGKNRKGVTVTGYEGTFTIQRSDFGMKMYLDGGLGDDVTITIAVEGLQQ